MALRCVALGAAVLLVALAGRPARAAADAGDGSADASRWVDAVVTARRVAGASQVPAGFAPAQSRLLRRGEPAQTLALDVTGVDLLWLRVTDGGDGLGCDHAAWGEPVLTLTDGRRFDLTQLRPVTWTVGWFDLDVDRNSRGLPIHIGGQAYRPALFTHSPALVGYRLAGRFTRFEAKVGLDDDACGGSVIFEVRAEVPSRLIAEACWNRLAKRFPLECGWVSQDLPGGAHLDWLSGAAVTADRGLLEAVLAALGPGGARLAAEAGTLAAGPPPAADSLALYLKARRRLQEVQDLQTALDFARRTLRFVEQEVPRPEFPPQISALAVMVAGAVADPTADLGAVRRQVLALRRRIILTHPLLAFDTLLINQQPPTTYSHQCDQYLGRHSRPGPGLVLLHDWRSESPRRTVLLQDRLPRGSVAHPDLSFDARRVVFAFCDHRIEPPRNRRFLLYEIGVDGNGLRQLTGTTADPLATADGRRTVLIEDFDPCYLPDGGIAFISTRCQNFGRCHVQRYNPAYVLHRMDRDGSGIRQLSFGEANEWDPSVLADGRLIYTRWDYVNRHDTLFQSLWTMRPDGSNTAHFYGNASPNPCMTAEARSIPGEAWRVVATATAHHAYTAGSIIAIDPRRGQDGPEPIARLTPEVRFPETEGWDMKGCFTTPWPLSADLLLAACCPDEPLARQGMVQGESAFAIYLVDTLGGRELIYRDPSMSCLSPIPLQPRPVPPVLPAPASAPTPTGTGVLFVRDVRRSLAPLAVPVSALRINAISGQPTAAVPHRGRVRQELVKRIVGTTPVAADGSACVTVPAGVPLQLQALDGDGMAVMTMRTCLYVQDGETAGCVGCHEPRQTVPPVAPPASVGALRPPDPPAGPRYDGGFSYPCSVQPVLDRYCISCHGLARRAGELSLLGSPLGLPVDGYPGWPATVNVSESYAGLLARPGLICLAQRNEESAVSRPRDYFAHAGRLARRLLDGHCAALLADRASLSRVIDWLDLNAQFNGDYSWNRPGERPPEPEGEKALRAWIAQRWGAARADEPFAALVNAALPAESRVLRAPLDRAAGGWGQWQDGGFATTADPQYQRLEALVARALAALPANDREGTCGRPRCVCGCCWVRDAWRLPPTP